MEKLQIAKYGMMQVTAVVYGILISGGIVKICERAFADGHPMPSALYRARFFYDYGFWLFVIVIGWTTLASYLSSPFSPWDFDSDNLALSGLILAILLALLSSFFGFGALAALFAPVS